jgi:exonuclease VII small subunit
MTDVESSAKTLKKIDVIRPRIVSQKETISFLTDRVSTLESVNSTLESANSALESAVAALETEKAVLDAKLKYWCAPRRLVQFQC